MSLTDGLCEPVKCTNCGAVSVKGGSLACWKCFTDKEQEIDRLRKDLKKYGSHLHWCDIIHGHDNCDCGFDEALKE